MNTERLTTKSREVITGAVAAGQPARPRHRRAVAPAAGAAGHRRLDRRRPAARRRGQPGRRAPGRRSARSTRLPAARGSSVAEPTLSREFVNAIGAAEQIARPLGDEYTSTEHLLAGLARVGGAVADALKAGRRHRGEPGRRLPDRPRRRPAGHHRRPGADLPGAGEVRRRPDRQRPRRQDRPGHRPGLGDPPGDPGAVPAYQEQPGADRRARRRQDRHRRGPGPADRRRRRAGDRCADKRLVSPRPGRDGRRRAVPRPVRGAAQVRAGGDQELATARSSPSSTSCTPSSAPARARARWTPATCSSRCWPAASCGWSARPRWTSTASTSRRTRRWSAASSRCWSASRPSRTPSASCAASRSATRCTTAYGSPTPRWSPPPRLSDRYITDRFLPDKAIDLVDEAASRLRMEIDSRPVEVDEIERAVRRLEIEEMALAKEPDPASRRAAGAAARGAGRQARAARRALRPVANGEGAHRQDLRRQGAAGDAAAARPSGPSATASWNAPSELRYGRIPELERRAGRGRGGAGRAAGRRRDAQGGGRRRTTSPPWSPSWTGIPAGRLMEGETAKLLRMEESLRAPGGRPARGGRRGLRRGPPGPGRRRRPGPARPAASSSSARPASARPSWPRRSPSSSSTTSGPWSAST